MSALCPIYLPKKDVKGVIYLAVSLLDTANQLQYDEVLPTEKYTN